MPAEVELSRNLFYIVITGQFNPAILNHQFLVEKAKAIPPGWDEPEVVILPVMAALDYKKKGLKVLVELTSFVVSHELIRADVPRVLRVARSYMKRLDDTPVSRISLHSRGQVCFPTPENVADFEGWILRDKRALVSCLDTDTLDVSVKLSYGLRDFSATMNLGPLDSQQNHVEYWLHYDKEVCDAREIIRVMSDKNQITELLVTGDRKLKNLSMGGPTFAYH